MPLKKYIRKILTYMQSQSLKSVGFDTKRLINIAPDISEHYSFTFTDKFTNLKVRNMHAFQVSLIDEVMENFNARSYSRHPSVIDIGAASGVHLEYIRFLYPEAGCVGIDIDAGAVEKIKARGFDAFQIRAEDLRLEADIFLCFEVLEHLTDPYGFLCSLPESKYLIVTVPYLKNSRIGQGEHVFELSPKDWKSLFNRAGWIVINENLYRQSGRLMRYIWRKLDFEGFYGFILRREDN